MNLIAQYIPDSALNIPIYDVEKETGSHTVCAMTGDVIQFACLKKDVIGGNSIRGLMRRLLMYDYCKQLGIEKLEKEAYHRLFTGGTLSDSTGVEDMAARRGISALCPPIALLGSAVGSGTIQGGIASSRCPASLYRKRYGRCVVLGVD